MDVSIVRSEIKAWEHAFKAKHAREPSVQDIKDEPAIGTFCRPTLAFLGVESSLSRKVQAVQEAQQG